jgi:hypothetical protein
VVKSSKRLTAPPVHRSSRKTFGGRASQGLLQKGTGLHVSMVAHRTGWITASLSGPEHNVPDANDAPAPLVVRQFHAANQP